MLVGGRTLPSRCESMTLLGTWVALLQRPREAVCHPLARMGLVVAQQASVYLMQSEP